MNDHNNNIQLETAMTTTTMTMIQALRSAMDVMLERDDNVVVFGQDVGYFGGVFRCTEGLQTKYGKSRVFDAPISESGIVGVAVPLEGWAQSDPPLALGVAIRAAEADYERIERVGEALREAAAALTNPFSAAVRR